MVTPERIDEMDIDTLKANFFSFVSDVVVTYGDDQAQPFPVVCPGSESTPVALPGEQDQSKPVRCS